MKMKSLRNIKIKTKLIMLAIVSILGLVVLGQESVVTASRLNQRAQQLYDTWLSAVITAEGLNTAVSDYRIKEGYHVITTKPEMMQEMQQELQELQVEIDSQFEQYKSYQTAAEDQQLVARAQEVWEAYLVQSEALLDVSRRNNREEALELLLGDSLDLFNETSELFRQSVVIAKHGVDQMRRETQQTYNNMVYTKTAVIGGVSLIVLILILYLIQAIEKPVEALQDAARRATNGDLEIYLEVQAEDEIGVLTDAVNQLMKRLRDIIRDERRIFREIGSENYEVQSECERAYRGDFAPVLYALTSLESRLRDMKDKHREEMEKAQQEIRELKHQIEELKQQKETE